MTRPILFLALLVFLPTLCQTAQADSAKPFVVPGLLSIESPHPKFKWRKERTHVGDDATAHLFICSDSPNSQPLVLVVNEKTALADYERQSIVFDSFKMAQQFVEHHGFEITKGKLPDIKKIADNRVTYGLVAKHKSADVEIYIAGFTIFTDRRTYTLQAMAPTAASTKQMLSVTKTLKELAPAPKLGSK